MAEAITLAERGREIRFTYDDMVRFHGHGSPGGVAHGLKMLQRALPLLDPAAPCERREIVIATAFGGPGARDAIELATRAVSGDRFELDASLARPERGRTLERFVFRLAYRDRAVTVAAREGSVPGELIELARVEHRTPDQAARLDVVKLETAERVLALPASDVYEVLA
jgi:formylmethanofuran dehydrogenase subunit E